MYAHTDDEIYLGLYGSSRTENRTSGGSPLDGPRDTPFRGAFQAAHGPTSGEQARGAPQSRLPAFTCRYAEAILIILRRRVWDQGTAGRY